MFIVLPKKKKIAMNIILNNLFIKILHFFILYNVKETL